jgi:addiction module HigA family antidote
MLREDFLPEFQLTIAGLADAVGVSRQSVNELLRGRRAVSPEMALRFARLFGNSPEFWLNAQRAVDLWEATRAIQKDVKRIKPLRIA